MPNSVSRRDVLTGAAAAAIGTLIHPLGGAYAQASESAASNPQRPRKRSIRLAHLTDSHVQPERRAAEGMAACLRHVQSLSDPVELVLTGGDLIMDAFEAERARTKLQWDVYLKTLAEGCRLPVEHCLGNHDIWGWHKTRSGATGSEPDYGKRWAMDLLGLKSPYRSFDRAGWHFIVLDSVAMNGDGYIGKVDAEQLEWLAADLAKTPATTPILVISHIPILTACVLTGHNSAPGEEGGWKIPSSWMITNGGDIRSLFAKHSNVRVCLSGHIHLIDRVDYNGVSYFCDGAVSGAWWRGKNHECAEGYAVLDLYDDGTFENRYVEYGWVAEK